MNVVLQLRSIGFALLDRDRSFRVQIVQMLGRAFQLERHVGLVILEEQRDAHGQNDPCVVGIDHFRARLLILVRVAQQKLLVASQGFVVFVLGDDRMDVHLLGRLVPVRRGVLVVVRVVFVTVRCHVESEV